MNAGVRHQTPTLISSGAAASAPAQTMTPATCAMSRSPLGSDCPLAARDPTWMFCAPGSSGQCGGAMAGGRGFQDGPSISHVVH